MFTTTKHPTFISSVTPIAEKHGEETKLACSIKCELTMAKTVLDAFGLKKLREALYRKPAAGEQQELPMEGSDGHTALAFPKLSSLRIEEDFTGYKVHVDSGLGISEGIHLSEVTLKKVSLDPIEGGSVKVGLSLVCHPDAATIGALCDMLQDTVDLTLTPPAASQQKAA